MTVFDEVARKKARERIDGLRDTGRNRLMQLVLATNSDVNAADELLPVAELDAESAALVAGLQAAGRCIAGVALALHECPMADLPALIERLNAAVAGA